MKVTPQQLKEWQARGMKVISGNVEFTGSALANKNIDFAEIKVVKKPKMNKTERAYAAMLEMMKRNNEIIDYKFEGITVKLGNGVRYTADFMVIRTTQKVGEYFDQRSVALELHETKGPYIRDDARIKFQCARTQFPWFKWKMMQLKEGSWSEIHPE